MPKSLEQVRQQSANVKSDFSRHACGRTVERNPLSQLVRIITIYGPDPEAWIDYAIRR